MRRRAGDGLGTVAAALGVADWSLRRWLKASKNQIRFHPVHVVTPTPVQPISSIVICLTADGPRVEGRARPICAKGFDGLCALVTQGLHRDVLSGDVFIFVSRDRVRAKTLQGD